MLEVEGVVADHEVVARGRDLLIRTWVASTLSSIVRGSLFEERVGIFWIWETSLLNMGGGSV